MQGKILGTRESLRFTLQREALLATLTQDVLRSSEIEGELLDPAQVWSSIARKLGLDISGLVPSDRAVDGVVDILMDTTQKSDNSLTRDRLYGWHHSLFPSGYSGMYKISTGTWRGDTTGPMQVVSGAVGKERVHFQAPPSEQVPEEMETFLAWFNASLTLDPVIKAGIAHL